MEKARVALNLGCGIAVRRGFINVDPHIDPEALKQGALTGEGPYGRGVWEEGGEFLSADVRSLPLQTGSVDYAESINMLEHLPIADVGPALVEICRVLRPGGILRAVVPDFSYNARAWLAMEEHEADLSGFRLEEYVEIATRIYGNQLHPGEYHCTPFSPRMIQVAWTSAGFREVRMARYIAGGPLPPMESDRPDPGMVLLADSFLVEARKPLDKEETGGI